MDDLNPEPTVEVLYKAQAILGEGPFYEEKTGTLLWVDVENKKINFLDPIAKKNRSVECPDKVSAVIPVEGSDKLLALLITRKQICLVDRNTGNVTDVLQSLEEDKPQNKLNDAKCDSSGRLWFGSMGNTTRPDQIDRGGAFYSYSAGVLTKHCSDVALSNGIGWNLEDDVLYHIDSYSLKLFSHSYNKLDGSLSNQETFIDFTSYAHEQTAFADGMCTDTKGRIWVALFNGQCVTCWDPNSKEKLLTVKIPGAKRITSCCFGGPNYEWLFVTTATLFAGEEELVAYPNSGHVFVIKDLGARGTPANKFKLMHKLDLKTSL